MEDRFENLVLFQPNFQSSPVSNDEKAVDEER